MCLECNVGDDTPAKPSAARFYDSTRRARSELIADAPVDRKRGTDSFMDELDSAINNLQATVDALIAQIDPILGPNNPEPSDKDGFGGEGIGLSVVNQRLYDSIQMLNSTRRFVRNISERVEL